MKFFRSLAPVLLAARLVHAVPYVASEGSNFIIQGNGNRFDIIGLE